MGTEKYFVIGIGGTGMRCIEAFTHMCAIGMFDNKEIDILSIDTDTNNGNKGRSEQLIDRYIRIKGGAQGKPTANSFFTAKLNIYKFAPEYSGNRLTYELISGLNSGSEDIKKDNKTLSDLFFDDDVQKFKLDHGYRAQTHLGSHLMYHCIVEAARNVSKGGKRKEDLELSVFLDKIYQAGENARVFILGSIFGGTGASAIPIIPKALRDAVKIKDKNAEIHSAAKFGCSLLSEYFSFNVPDSAQKKEQKVIADSNNFSRNSQAALMFYQADTTVKSTYKLMYHIGWPKRTNFSQGDASTKTITGGGEQKNPCHVSELFCACAAYDFFNKADGLDQHDIVFKSANFQNDSFLFEFQDFLGEAASKDFMNRIGTFLAFSHIIINYEKGGWGQSGAENLVEKFKEFNIPDYTNLSLDEAKDIDEFVKAFAFNYDTKGNVIPGWFFQIRQSVDGPFLFHTDAFSTNSKQLRDFHFGKLFLDDAYQFAKKGKLGIGAGDPYGEFRTTIQKDATVKPSPEKQKVERLNERFLAHTYNTLTKLFKIVNN
jgi:hypothetical protein